MMVPCPGAEWPEAWDRLKKEDRARSGSRQTGGDDAACGSSTDDDDVEPSRQSASVCKHLVVYKLGS